MFYFNNNLSLCESISISSIYLAVSRETDRFLNFRLPRRRCQVRSLRRRNINTRIVAEPAGLAHRAHPSIRNDERRSNNLSTRLILATHQARPRLSYGVRYASQCNRTHARRWRMHVWSGPPSSAPSTSAPFTSRRSKLTSHKQSRMGHHVQTESHFNLFTAT